MITHNRFRVVSFGAASRLTLGQPYGELVEVDFTLWEAVG